MQQPQRAQPPPGGKLGDALRNLQKYVQTRIVQQPEGQQPGVRAAIQFDTKGVEFGPWIRRFVAQVRRNWFVPDGGDVACAAASSSRSTSIATARITDVTVIGPSEIDSFNTGRQSTRCSPRIRPTPLPPEYPDDKAFFTVTFYYNESPAGQSAAGTVGRA